MEDDEELERLRRKKMRELMKRSREEKMSDDVPTGVIHVDSNKFNEIINSNRPVLVDFFTDWCPPCKTMAPIIEALAKDYAGKVVFAKVNCDTEATIARRFSIVSVPTFIFFKNGEPVKQVVGAVQKEKIEKIIKKLLDGK